MTYNVFGGTLNPTLLLLLNFWGDFSGIFLSHLAAKFPESDIKCWKRLGQHRYLREGRTDRQRRQYLIPLSVILAALNFGSSIY